MIKYGFGFLFFLAFAPMIFAQSVPSDSIAPMQGLSVQYAPLHTRFFDDSTEISEVILEKKLLSYNRKALTAYHSGQLQQGLGGTGFVLAGLTSVITGADALFALGERREGYETAYQLPLFCALGSAIGFLVLQNGKNTVKTTLKRYNNNNEPASGIANIRRRIEWQPARSGVGVAMRF